MITSLSPLYSKVSTYAKPEDILLQKGGWVRFTDQWPDTYKWARGNTFAVIQEPIIVSYAVTRTAPAGDYCDIDLSNSTAGLKLYPASQNILYQMAVGLKPGNYLVQTYIPSAKYVYDLGDSSMFPDVASATLMYLGAKQYRDSPYETPLWYLYSIKDMAAFILRLLVLGGVDFEKMTLEFKINKCQLSQIIAPTPEQIDKALLLRWYTELTGF